MKQDLSTCHLWEEKLAARHPDDSNHQEHEALEAHLATCNDCASQRTQYDLLTERIRATVASEQFEEADISILITPRKQTDIWVTTYEEPLPLRPDKPRKKQPLRRSKAALGISFAILLILMLTGLAFLPHNENTLVGSASQVTQTPVDSSQNTAKPPAIDANNPYTVVRQPTLNAQQIDTILKAYHSPLAGKGQVFYNWGKTYNIDPVFLLAISMHDTELGKTAHAQQTHSLTILGCYQGVHCLNRYAAYDSWDKSIKDLYIIFTYYIQTWHETTVDTIVPTFNAPVANTPSKQQADVRSIKHMMDEWRSGKIILSK